MYRSATVLSLILISLAAGPRANAQGGPSDSLLPGTTLARTLASGQRHSFSLNLDKDQFVQVVVEQHGIDVIIRVSSPDGKSLGTFDTPNGAEGPESVSLVSTTAGVYWLEVAPLGKTENLPAGRYEIKISELRQATELELQAGKSQEVLKARGLALLAEVADSFSQIRLPQTRVRAQLQAAQLLWQADEKLALRLAGDAVEGVKEYVASIDVVDQGYYQSYELAMQLRQEVVQILGPRDPDAALAFLRTTRTLESPQKGQENYVHWDRELQFELSLAMQITSRDPKRAGQIAEEGLKRGYSASLIEIVARLRATDPELATKIAKQIAAKLQGENLLKNQGAANVAVGLLRLAHYPVGRSEAPASTSARPRTEIALLSEQEYKDLFEKTLAEALAYKALPDSAYSQERNTVQNILNVLKSMTPELTGYAPASVSVVEKRVAELNTPADPQGARWQKLQEALNTGTVDDGLEQAGRAPRELRDQLYQQVAQKALGLGDLPRARQILTDHLTNPMQRQQALSNLEQQSIQMIASKGRIDEALRLVSTLRTPRERATMLSQVITQIGPGQKRAAALELLEQARSLLGTTTRVESQEQMTALMEIAAAFSRYDSKRAFEVVEPLLDQFNEMSAAALVLNGFGQEFYEDGELAMQNGNIVANIGNQLIASLGMLATSNFDRARAGADRLERPEVRMSAYLAIAKQTIGRDAQRRNQEYRRFQREW